MYTMYLCPSEEKKEIGRDSTFLVVEGGQRDDLVEKGYQPLPREEYFSSSKDGLEREEILGKYPGELIHGYKKFINRGPVTLARGVTFPGRYGPRVLPAGTRVVQITWAVRGGDPVVWRVVL